MKNHVKEFIHKKQEEARIKEELLTLLENGTYKNPNYYSGQDKSIDDTFFKAQMLIQVLEATKGKTWSEKASISMLAKLMDYIDKEFEV